MLLLQRSICLSELIRYPIDSIFYLLLCILINRICPIGDRVREYEADPLYLDQVLAEGAEQAREIATATMKEVKDAMGLSP